MNPFVIGYSGLHVMARTDGRLRFEVLAAYTLGVGLPILEVARRRTDFGDIPAYIDDFIIGALLLGAARAVSRGRSYGYPFLASAWGVLCGGLWSSVFGQIASSGRKDVSGLPNQQVLFIKLAVYAVAIVALVMSVRRAAAKDPASW